MKRELTVTALCQEAGRFADRESKHHEPGLYGVTDGKAVGTYFEHKFQAYLGARYTYEPGSSASGIDFPALRVDMKVTSAKRPQSSCPFGSARQKVHGLGYSLLVFIYEKTDDHESGTGSLCVRHIVFIDEHRTADYQMTRGLLQILENEGNEEDLVAFMLDRNLPLEEIEAHRIARQLLETPPGQGYLTVSNALQWRLQYGRVIKEAGVVDGIERIR